MTAQRSGQSLIDGLRRGDEDAVQRLWDDFFPRLVDLARKRLQALPPQVADPSGATLSAMNSFVQRVRRGDYPQLSDRDDLWRILSVITRRKALRAIRDEYRQKRGGGKVVGQSALNVGAGDDDLPGLANAVDRDPTPEMAAILTEELEHRLELLGDDVFKQVAVMKLHGYSNREIANRLDCSSRTIERKLHVIRKVWEE